MTEETQPANAERFLDAFRTIEAALLAKSTQKYSKQPTFYDLVDDSKLLTSSQKEKLKQFAKLRNAIVHEPHQNGVPIADPRNDAVDWIERQALIIEKPPLVRNVLKIQPPLVLNKNSEISEFLELVSRFDFSQAPVGDGARVVALITTNAVTRWISSAYISNQGALVEESKIAEILTFSENTDEVAFKPKDLKVVDALRIFSGENTLIPPAAILITETGKPDEKPLGICVKSDVQALYKSIGF